jgi:hypothetical protein
MIFDESRMKTSGGQIGEQLTDALNRDCHCISVNKEALHNSLEAHLRDSGLPEQLLDTHSHVFADSPVFLWHGHIKIMGEVIRAIERVTRNKSFRNFVLSAAPEGARQDLGPRGVFFGYDFHLGAQGPRLIEINTNAGGALLNLYLAAAQQACCAEVITSLTDNIDFAEVETELFSMFINEWKLQRPTETLHTVAIVDNEPAGQFLYAELLLFQSLFERRGIKAIVADPKDFAIREGGLWVGEQKIDLVYNRLTDFYLQSPESTCLPEAYRQGVAVFSPSPYVYALYADKRNLTLLSDPIRLREFGIDDETIATLEKSVPATVVVKQDNADQLWKNRKQLFFKPVTSYGSRGAYRGAKLTRRVWQNIVSSEYVAQAIVPPSERQLIINGEEKSLKLDIRCVTYDSEIQLLSARLYQGQTTNLRTEGGGLATVFPTPKGDCC